MCGLDPQRTLTDYDPPPDPLRDTRRVVVCHPEDEALARIAGDALGFKVHCTRYGPDPGQVYLFNPAILERLEFDYVARPLPEDRADPWWDIKAALRARLKP